MNAVGTGVVVIVNGLWTLLTSMANPLTIFGIVLVAALWWLAAIEVDSLNRIAVKPTVGRH